jgi:5-methylcytosine-specific restriction endonuclease McrA
VSRGKKVKLTQRENRTPKKYKRFYCCLHCGTATNDVDFSPEVPMACRNCCEKIWEETQRKAREKPEECLLYAKQSIFYWAWDGRQYAQYKILRQKRLVHAGFQCEKCAAKGSLHLHHLTYVRVGNELLDDVQILCPSCHRKADTERHRLEKAGLGDPPELLADMRLARRKEDM